MRLEIVTHCWHYAPQLTYQLSSLALFPPQQAEVMATVFWSPEDSATRAVLDFFGRQTVERVCWNFRQLPKNQLFRRAIGRNQAALDSAADWIWFADADVLFRERCLDELSQVAQTVRDDLIYPRSILISRTHEMGDRTLDAAGGHCAIRDITPGDFAPHCYSRAIGGVQIVRGETARRIGYCRDHRRYQQPVDRWKSFYDDVIFRREIGTPGHPVELPQLYRIRHHRHGPRDESGRVM